MVILNKKEGFPRRNINCTPFPYSFLAKTLLSVLSTTYLCEILIFFLRKANAVLDVMPILLFALNFGEKIIKANFHVL